MELWRRWLVIPVEAYMKAVNAEQLFGTITGSAQKDWNKDEEGKAGLLHIAALSFSKLSDGLLNPKLVLSWLLTALGAPAYIIGFLVPIREAGALLPQAVLARFIERLQMRRWVCVSGAVGQGLSALLIALAALAFEGVTAGWVICGLLACLAVSRAACSVSYKDILGKTVGQTRRGAVTGLAGSLAAAGVFCFTLLMVGGVMKDEHAVIGAVGLAGALWLTSAATLAQLPEQPSSTKSEADTEGVWSILRRDRNLRRFIAVRGMLVSTALAPPYLVILAGQSEGTGLGQLGALLVASSAASFLSSYIWGRMADSSSRRVLAVVGFLGAVSLSAAVFAGVSGYAEGRFVIPVILFALMLAYHGVRQARSTYLVDIAPEEQRAAYAAAANVVIGTILLLAGAMGGALSWIGPYGALVGFAVMSAAGGLLALGLKTP
jgi:MFS family permease